jgi:hypothetical protein
LAAAYDWWDTAARYTHKVLSNRLGKRAFGCLMSVERVNAVVFSGHALEFIKEIPKIYNRANIAPSTSGNPAPAACINSQTTAQILIERIDSGHAQRSHDASTGMASCTPTKFAGAIRYNRNGG